MSAAGCRWARERARAWLTAEISRQSAPTTNGCTQSFARAPHKSGAAWPGCTKCAGRERDRGHRQYLNCFDRHAHRSNKLTSVTTSSGKSLEAVPSIANSLHIILHYIHMSVCVHVWNVTSLRGGGKRSHWRRRNHTTSITSIMMNSQFAQFTLSSLIKKWAVLDFSIRIYADIW